MTKVLVAAGAGLTGLILIVAITAAVAGGVPSTAGAGYTPSADAQTDIPPEMLALYQAAGAAEGLDWTILAAIGKIETNHCRSTLPGVHSGANFAGAMGCMQFLAGTWAGYGDGGSPYDPADAIPAAARYLKASGAPGDYHRAIFSYNHAEWYVQDVMTQAAAYRGAAALGTLNTGGSTAVTLDGAQWLSPVPGTSEQCDRRIVPDVVWLLETYHAQLTACYATSGHEAGGEHPLGVGADIVPGAGGSWALLDQMAHDLGWREACATTGCAEQAFLKPFRFIGWNGYPGHGDPAHAGANAHIHLSWAHSAGPAPVETVYVMQGDKSSGTPSSDATGDTPVLMEGDSLAVGSGPALKRLWPGLTTRARVGRTSTQGAADLRGVDAPRTLVVSLGTNDSSVQAFKASVRVIKATGARIVWVNVKGNPSGLDARLNAVLRANAGSRFVVADWAGLVESGAVRLSDGVHPTADGYEERARLIDRALRE